MIAKRRLARYVRGTVPASTVAQNRTLARLVREVREIRLGEQARTLDYHEAARRTESVRARARQVGLEDEIEYILRLADGPQMVSNGQLLRRWW